MKVPLPAFAPLAVSPNLAEKVASVLREQVVGGNYGEAARLPTESAMSVQFGVSRTVVREAVSRLKSEGLLVSRQGSGVFVHSGAHLRPLRIEAGAGRSEDSVLHIVELRRAIEGESAALAAQRRDRSDLDAMRAALRDLGVDCSDPRPADSLFHPDARSTYDAVVCMYHDQALIPIKMLDFWGGVNVTLGLPIVRTSPDHGVGFDIAGRGLARPDSLIAAIRLASEIAARRRRNRRVA